MTESESEVLNKAIAALISNTGLRASILDRTISARNSTTRTPDAVLQLSDTEEEYPVEIKSHVQNVSFGSLVDQVKRLAGQEPGLLVADYINPRMAERLKEAGVQFIDTAGNAYINRLPIFVLITGKKQLKGTEHSDLSQINRAFEPKGLLVTYTFLEDPSLATRPYREISRVSGVSVGTVGWVINALKAGQFMNEDSSTGERRITNYEKMLDRWVSAWPEKLRYKHLLGRFTVKDPHWWKHTNIQKYEACWGGETAAAIYTKHLKPQVATAYVPEEQLSKLIRDSRLSKASEREPADGALVYLYSPFWNTCAQNDLSDHDDLELREEATQRRQKNRETPLGLANPVLVYADLIATGDPRNLEAAHLLRDEYIIEPDRTA